MAKLDLALVVRTVDQATGPLRRIQKSVRDLTRRTGLDRVAQGIRATGRRMRYAGEAAGRFARKVGLIATALGALIGLPALKAFATLESLEVAFESMLGSTDAAAAMIKELTEFSAKTPFQLKGIGDATKTLLAFGVGGDEIVGKLKFLGDIAAGAGIPLKDLAQIYGKTMAKGKAQTEELNQMSERGIPILEALVTLAASYGNEISKEDVYKAAERGQITFKAIEEALQLMTAEGGIFNEQMERQSQTLSGLSSTVKDNVFLAFAQLGEQISETFNIKDKMRDFIVWLQDLTAELKKPREEQEGFARALTEGLRGLETFFIGLDNVFGDIAASIAAIHSAWKEFVEFLDSTFQLVKDAINFISAAGGASGGPVSYRGGATGGSPSLFTSSAAGGDRGGGSSGTGGGGVSYRGSSKASVTVDFRNMPRGTRTETRADSDTDLEVTTGYAMSGAW